MLMYVEYTYIVCMQLHIEYTSKVAILPTSVWALFILFKGSAQWK